MANKNEIHFPKKKSLSLSKILLSKNVSDVWAGLEISLGGKLHK